MAPKHQEVFACPALASIPLSLCYSLVRREIRLWFYSNGKGIWIPIFGMTALLIGLLCKEKSLYSTPVTLKELG